MRTATNYVSTTKNPGFDFSGAEISGNFHGGGPDFSSLQK